MSAPRCVLIAGYGSIGRRHARVIRSLDGTCRIVALRRAPGMPDDGNVDAVVTSVAEALTQEPDAAVIANPASEHLAVAAPLAAAGVPLLIEKPLAAAPEGVADLIAACERGGVTLAVGYNLRFDPSLQRFRNALAQARVGRVLSVRAEVGQYLPDWRPGADYRRSVSARAELGGGVLLELSHELDYLRWLFGEAHWVRATSARQSDLDIDVEDVAHLAIGFAGHGGREIVARVDLDFVRRDTTRRCTAIGERGSLRWDALAGTVELFEPGASGWVLLGRDERDGDATYRSQWQHFVRSLVGEATPAAGGADGLAVLHLIDAARCAAAAPPVAL